MKAAPVAYHRADSVDSAITLLLKLGDGARAIAGGQTLTPMMNLRLARPQALVDVRTVPDLRRIDTTDTVVKIGAAVTHAEIEDGRVPDAFHGLLHHVAARIAYRGVRNRGTIGGSLAHADPAADWPSVLMALGAEVNVVGPDGRRTVPIHDFFTGAFRTVLAPAEIAASVTVPRLSPSARWGYVKLARKLGDFAHALALVVADPPRRHCRIVVGAIEATPAILAELSRDVARQGGGIATPDRLMVELSAAAPGLDPVDLHLHSVALRRAIAQVFP